MSEERKNPYVGPRTFTTAEGNLFFGRELEARELLATVLASDRLVVFYAQSGAGKSSLINTRLIPGLEAQGFHVLPVGRVNGYATTTETEIENIFAYNLLLSVNAELGQEAVNIDTSTTLPRFLQLFNDEELTEAGTFAKDEGYDLLPQALIIDQFEEIITTNVEAWQQIIPFFTQLYQAMRQDSSLYVILSLREDYVAALAPYADIFPGKMRTRFYMRRMEEAAARQAITRPAAAAGLPFSTAAADMLVNNLRRIHAEGVPGHKTVIEGQYIEPVHLQIVCHDLWKNLPAGQQKITTANLKNLGDVDQALINFYESVLQRVVADSAPQRAETAAEPVTEAQLRRWFGQELITPAHTRGLVYRGTNDTHGLPNNTVDLLVKNWVIRAEIRGGGAWYELVHDRLIEPIERSNQAWELKKPPEITEFSVTPRVITYGSRVTFRWAVENSDQVLVEPGSHRLEPRGKISLYPDSPAYPTRSTGYTLHATRTGARPATSPTVPLRVEADFSDDFWNSFFGRLRQGRVTPIVSDAVTESWISGGYQQLLQRYAAHIGYPFSGEHELFRMTQFQSVQRPEQHRQDYLDFVRSRLQDSLAAQGLVGDDGADGLKFSEMYQKLRPAGDKAADDALALLARLPLPLFITTSYYSTLEGALLWAGKKPQSVVCRWDDPTRHDDDRLPEGTLVEPVVFHIFGSENIPDSLVLTEEDYLRFLIRVNEDRDLIPIFVREAIYRGTPLLIGYNWESWPFRVLLQGVLSHNIDRRIPGLMQLALTGAAQQNEADEIAYLERYFHRFKFDIFWGDFKGLLVRIGAGGHL
jgi:hypothetical protein